ncbi:LuxR C-terminal-related transcriptional regulator [Horticoccus luteus]|uniref:LuxR C-terminal-related transcriptional regulator n=1 Tax=Horticoccus luteus TaxID=2862869 RepID=A0A8F9XJY2_9BACT|nr:LuxR C-terminal-related transcriptional regulator [Horticoccus luteus]QYM79148.1 LuxR C-terminal-related transcriptional regulator [Horticoccus luteus]
MVRLPGASADPLGGWRPMALSYLRPLPQNQNFTAQRLRAINRGQTDESVTAQARLAGTFRAHRLRDIVSPAWFESAYYQNYLDRGIHDSLTVALPVNAMTESYYGFLRMRPLDPFTETQRQIAAYALRGLPVFHRHILLAHGVGVAAKPFSPVERKAVAHLLTDKSEKDIAAALGVTATTAHTYIRDVLDKLGVKGRAGLAALWLGQPPDNKPRSL